MLSALFARLTGNSRRGQAMFDMAVSEARQPRWVVEGEVPDTVNGRFAVLATIIALLTVRLEREGDAGQEASVALTERLVETIDAEIREGERLYEEGIARQKNDPKFQSFVEELKRRAGQS